MPVHSSNGLPGPSYANGSYTKQYLSVSCAKGNDNSEIQEGAVTRSIHMLRSIIQKVNQREEWNNYSIPFDNYTSNENYFYLRK
jgi:hypothetical protein